jgi:glycosyltransferase involved in cell wall biosynthesis
MQVPAVSILIPTFNRAHYVGDAINSAIRQTFSDIEIIVVDDGSTDSTNDVIKHISDARLRVVSHDYNRGIPETRNTALAAAKGRYIAWLDSDDISRPTRIEKQVRFLRDNPSIAMVGSAAGKINVDGTPRKGIRMPPLKPEMIAAWLLFRSAFQQSSIMGRAAILKEYSYDPNYQVCEDTDMFVRLQRKHALANLPAILIDRRLHPEQTVRQFRKEILVNREALITPTLQDLGVDATPEDRQRHVLLGLANLQDLAVEEDFLIWARSWLSRLLEANARTKMFDEGALDTASDYFWFLACRAMAPKIGRAEAIKSLFKRVPTSLLESNSRDWIKNAWPSYVYR